MTTSKIAIGTCSTFVLLVAIAVTALITLQLSRRNFDPYFVSIREDGRRHESLRSAAFHELSEEGPTRIRNNLRELTRTFHVAGTEEQLALNALIERRFRSYGLEVCW